ncbi:MAG: exodeoxyribonuclease VII small subunit [Clostridia bacterium]|nr:exodeoxyribonuclease VII small subunit [Clostridia bacterium]
MSEKKFSEMLSRLEEIVAALEKGDCELEASMELFDEGTTLAKICNEKLNNAQLKITNIDQASSGEVKK